MEKKAFLVGLMCLSVCLISCNAAKETAEQKALDREQLNRAVSTLDSLYKYYQIEESYLLRETYPFDDQHRATYLADNEGQQPNKFSYLWPYSGTFSSVNVLLEQSQDQKFRTLLDTRVLPGLENYFDTKRQPAAYASYVNEAAESDRFYDDNVWLGIDFTDIYAQTSEAKYLDKAKLILLFIKSGMDDKLGGGIYWVEQKKESKHTCSNAPGSVFALKLFNATKDSSYLHLGKELYDWTKANLQDTTDYLYYDNIRLDGQVSREKYAYNSGQMLQAAAMLYKITGDEKYKLEAQNIAKSGYDYFFTDYTSPEGDKFRLLKKTDIWFIAVMMRGYIELYSIDNDETYMNSFRKNLDHAWKHMRDENGLFNTDWTGNSKDEKKWLLTQAGMVEMYTRMASIK